MINVSKVEDFTEKLNENPLSFNFNPSIAHWKNDLYLVCYRTYVKNINYPSKGFSEKNKYLPNHPWADRSWDSEKGYDRTAFCIMKIKNGEINLYKELNKGDSINYYIDGNFYKSKDKNIKGVDARLIKIENDSFLVSYNKIVVDSFANIKEGNCSSGCLLIATRVITLINEELYLNKETVLCNKISNKTEKNWSFFKVDEKFYFSYGLTPTHLIYSLYFDNNRTICGDLKAKDKYEYYGNYEENVNPKLYIDSSDSENSEENYYMKKILHISVSTPAIQSREYKNRYIGVGHVKFSKLEKQAKQIKSELFQNFYSIILEKREQKEGYRKSLVYDYLMFIYEFEPENGHITRISDMFIPEDSKYLLAFPTGLIYIEDELWIFYGDHDSNCKVIKINNKYVSKLLKETKDDANSFYSEEINYFIFPKKCIEKSTICKLLLTM